MSSQRPFQQLQVCESSETSEQIQVEDQFMPSPLPQSFLSHKGPIETDKNDKLLTYVNMEKYMENPDLLQPTEYKVVETVYNMDDDDEFDTSECNNNRNGDNQLLRDELQSLDKNVLDFYGVVLDFNKFGQQMAKTTKKRGMRFRDRAEYDINNDGRQTFCSVQNYKKVRSISHHQENNFYRNSKISGAKGQEEQGVGRMSMSPARRATQYRHPESYEDGCVEFQFKQNIYLLKNKQYATNPLQQPDLDSSSAVDYSMESSYQYGRVTKTAGNRPSPTREKMPKKHRRQDSSRSMSRQKEKLLTQINKRLMKVQ